MLNDRIDTILISTTVAPINHGPFSASGPVKIILNFSCVNNNSNFSPSCNATEDKWRDKC